MSAPGWGWGSTTHPAAAIHTDIPFARLAGRAVYHGLLVLVVEALPLGDAGQLTLVWGWGRQGRKAEIPVRFKACPCHRGAWQGQRHQVGGEKALAAACPKWLTHPRVRRPTPQNYCISGDQAKEKSQNKEKARHCLSVIYNSPSVNVSNSNYYLSIEC